MSKKDRISCILGKILSIVIIISAFALVPSQIYLGAEVNITNISILIILSIIMFVIGWMSLLKTNNPLNRYNPFSLNKKWKSKMEHSFNENPLQIFKLDKPDKDEVRNKKIDDLLH